MLSRMVIAGLALMAATAQAVALGPDSTMAEWNLASSAERDALLDQLGPGASKSFKAEQADVLACLNSTGRNPAHASLPIGDVLKACVGIVEEHRAPGEDI